MFSLFVSFVSLLLFSSFFLPYFILHFYGIRARENYGPSSIRKKKRISLLSYYWSQQACHCIEWQSSYSFRPFLGVIFLLILCLYFCWINNITPLKLYFVICLFQLSIQITVAVLTFYMFYFALKVSWTPWLLNVFLWVIILEKGYTIFPSMIFYFHKIVPYFFKMMSRTNLFHS